MSRALEDLGVQTLIATTNAGGGSRLRIPLGVRTIYEEVPSVFFTRRVSESFKYTPDLARWLEASVDRFDVVHVHAVFSHSSIAAGRACQKASVPYLVRPLGSLAEWSLGRHRLRKRIAWKMMAERLVRGADLIHYTTRSEREQAERVLGLRHGVVIPLGVEEGLFRGNGDGTRFREGVSGLAGFPYALFLSRIDPKKELGPLVQAFSHVTRDPSLQRWRLVIAGDGGAAYVRRVRRLASDLPGGDRILFVGWLDGEIRESALRGAALLALPSKQENFGLAAVEALACGTPVMVGVGVDLAEEIHQARAGWVTALSGDGLRHTLHEALSDDEERRARGFAGKQYVGARYRWDAVGRQLVETYRALIEGRASEVMV